MITNRQIISPRAIAVSLLALASFTACATAQAPGAAVEKGAFKLHSLLHAIGDESYELTRNPGGDGVAMNISYEFSDRGNKRTISATLLMAADLTPKHFELKRGPATAATTPDSVEVFTVTATAREGDAGRVIPLPARYFVGFGYAPASIQMMMMRYWAGHGKPARLPILRANAAAEPAEIRFAGRDSITLDGKTVPLTRYTIANIVWGREIVWMNDQQQLAALMTFAGGLPFEAVRSEYEPALPQLFHDGVTQEMADLAAIERQVPPEKTGAYAIAGATLVDGTGRSPIPNSVVIVRDGRIAAAGPHNDVSIPVGMPVVNAAGQTLLPGLWEMHSHFSGIEFGPALLAAGITTVRDCGGEFEFLTTMRDEIARRNGLGPRMILAGLVDTSELRGFGAISADTPEEARAVADKYHDAGFQQLKLYTYLKPDVILALTSEAHRLGMSVTGHVPAALTTFEGVESGMDQINHLNYVSRTLRPASPGSGNPVNNVSLDLNSEVARNAIQFFVDHHTVVDPTASWGEMAGHTKDMSIASFEPGITKAPYTLSSKFTSLAGPAADSARFRARMAENLAVIGAIHKAGIPIVAGSDTGLVGYGLLREIELYAQAGMTPLEAIQSATIVPARAMKLDAESGSVEPGKRADLILVNGNPLENISDIRKVTRVVANGRLYKSSDLWQSVGFKP